MSYVRSYIFYIYDIRHGTNDANLVPKDHMIPREQQNDHRKQIYQLHYQVCQFPCN